MCAETLTFLHALFAGVQEGCLTFTAIHPDRTHPAPSRHIACGDDTALRSALDQLEAANACGWGAYFGVATRKADLGRWKRGGKRDLSTLPALFVDRDGDAEAQRHRLGQFPRLPSCIVSSGSGIHAYWFLAPTHDLAHADGVLYGLAQALGGDCMNIATSLRLPGTGNTKPTRHGSPCEVLLLEPGRRYTLADFAPWVSKGLPQAMCARRPRHTPAWPQGQPDVAIRAVTHCLIRHYDGYIKPNGYLAALCPHGHACDYPGCHFNYDTRRGCGMCFGRHGPQSFSDLRAVLGLAAR